MKPEKIEDFLGHENSKNFRWKVIIFTLLFLVFAKISYANYEFNQSATLDFSLTNEITTAVTNGIGGICFNGSNIMVVDQINPGKVFSYNPNTGAYANWNISTGDNENSARGIWCNSTHIFIAGGAGNNIRIYEISTKTNVANPDISGQGGQVRGITGSPNGSFLYVTHHISDDISVYDNKAGYAYTGKSFSTNEITGDIVDHYPAYFNETYFYVYSKNTPSTGTGRAVRYTDAGVYDNYNFTVTSVSDNEWGWTINTSDNVMLGDVVYGWVFNRTDGKIYRYPMNLTCLDSCLPSVPDINPPNITYYNLTSSDNGCESWNTDKNTACSTSFVTPTVQFNTSENAWCAVAGSSSSTSFNINYTEMGSSRNCTGAASGEGTREHFCTLTSQDELVYDTSYLFISCKDASGNMNRSGTSTSGALKLSITGLETAGRNSIGLGIQNALLSGYTNYTDLQIYARNLSNAQVRGTFDRVAKKGSKMWAFNGIGVSDSYVNMFNLTPVLYNLEFANTTSARITNLTELMINATK